MVTTLNLLPIGRSGLIREITADHVTKERLESLGFIVGVEISAVRKPPLGSIRIYQCLNTLIALRGDIADKVRVEAADGQK